MATQEMKIKIGADIGPAVREMGRFSDSVNSAGDRLSDFTERLRGTDAAGQSFGQGFQKGASLIDSAFTDAIKPIEQLEKEIAALHEVIEANTDPAVIKKFGDQVVKLNSQLNNLKVVGLETSLRKLNSASALAGAGLGNIKPGSDRALNALTNLGRVVQDAPFGFIGIANNINPLVESFQRLQAESGSTKNALKVLVTSLGGAGGLGLAVSLGTAALSLLGQGFFSSGKSAKKAEGEVSDFEKTLSEAANAVGGDAAKITTLFNALTSGTLNTGQRKQALDELKRQNVEFFGSLNEEKGIINGLQEAYQNYLDKVLQIGRAKAIEAQLTKLFDKKIELELAIDPKFTAATTDFVQREIGRLKNELQVLGGEVDFTKLKNDEKEFADQTLQRRISLQQKIKKLEEGTPFFQDRNVFATKKQIDQIELQIKGLAQLQKDTGQFNISDPNATKEENDLLGKQLSLLEKLRDAQKEKVSKLFSADDIREATTELAKLETTIGDVQLKIALRDAQKNKLPQADINALETAIRNDTQKRLNEAFQKEALLLETSAKIKVTRVETVEIPKETVSEIAKATGFDKKIPITTTFDVRVKLLGQTQAEILKQIDQLRDNLAEALLQFPKNLKIEGLTSLADSLGESLAGIFSGEGIGKGIESAAQHLLQAIGGVLSEIGKQIISTSVLIKALKAALSKVFVNPTATLGLGIALVAAGSLLKNIKFNLPGFADGGVAKGPKSGFPVILHGEELIVPMNKVQKINTNSLSGVGGSIQLAPISIAIQGQQLRILLDRVDRSNGRFF